LQGAFVTLGKEIETAQAKADFPMNVQKYQQGLKAVEQLRNGYTGLVNGQKQVIPGLNQMMMATGAFNVETVKVADSTTRFTEALNKNKIGLGSVLRDLGTFKQNLSEATTRQAALQRASVATWSANSKGITADVYFPKTVGAELISANTKYGMIADSISKVGTATVNWGKNTQWAGRQITAGLSMPIALAAAGMAKLAYDADVQLTGIAKVYNTTTTASTDTLQGQMQVEKQLGQVRTASMENATKVAETYGAKVKDTLGIEQQLAALGKTGDDLYQSTANVMRVATLGDMDYNTALQMTMTLTNAFHEDAKQLGDSFNFINAVENQTSLTTKDVADALPRVGAAMATMGMTVQETVVLLTGFKEAGIDATEGANALKTAVARMADPTPKTIKYFDSLGISIKDVVKDSGGDFLKFMEELGPMMEKLSPLEKETAFKDLFGIQQSNRLLGLLNNISEITNNKIPAGAAQTAAAYKLAAQSAGSWKSVADQELKQFQNSSSGKFKIALASMQAELIKLGEPIMKALAPVLNVLSSVLHWFNSLPSGIKTVVAAFGLIAVLAGPLIMVVGLFGNLAGNAMKFFGALGRLATGFKPLTEAQAAEKALGDLAKQSWDGQSQAIAILAQKMGGLNKLMEDQIALQRQVVTGNNNIQSSAGKAAQAQKTAATVGNAAVPTVITGTPAAGTTAAKTTAAEASAGGKAVQAAELLASEALAASGAGGGEGGAVGADGEPIRIKYSSTALANEAMEFKNLLREDNMELKNNTKAEGAEGQATNTLASSQKKAATEIGQAAQQLSAHLKALAEQYAALRATGLSPAAAQAAVAMSNSTRGTVPIAGTSAGLVPGYYPGTGSSTAAAAQYQALRAQGISAAAAQAQVAQSRSAAQAARYYTPGANTPFAVGRNGVINTTGVPGGVVGGAQQQANLNRMIASSIRSELGSAAGGLGPAQYQARMSGAIPGVTSVSLTNLNNTARAAETNRMTTLPPVPLSQYQAAQKATEGIANGAKEAAEGAKKTGMGFMGAVGALTGLSMGVIAIKDMKEGAEGLVGQFMDLTMLAAALAMVWKGLNITAGIKSMSTGIAALGTEASVFSGMGTKMFTGLKTAGMAGLNLLKAGWAALLTPMGAAVAIAFTLGAAIYLINKNMNGLAKQQDAINDSAKDWASILGFTLTTQKSLAELQKEADGKEISGVTATQARQKAVNALADANGELVDKLKEVAKQDTANHYQGNSGLFNLAMGEAIKVKLNGGDIAQAKQAFEVALQAAGLGQADINTLDVHYDEVNLDDPKQVAAQLMTDINAAFKDMQGKDVNNGGWDNFWDGDGASDEANANAEKVAADYYQSLQTAVGDPQAQQAVTDSLAKQMNTIFTPDFNGLQHKNQDLFKKMAINNMQDLYKAVRDAEQAELDGNSTDLQEKLLNAMFGAPGEDGITRTGDNKEIAAYEEYWKNFLRTLGKQAGLTGKDLDNFVSKNLSVAEAGKQVGMGADEAAAGVKTAGDEAEKAVKGFSDLADAMNVDPSTYIATADQYVNEMKQAYSGAIQAATSQASVLWQRAQQAATKSIQDSSDAKKAAMESDKKAQDAAYDQQMKDAQAAADAENKAIEKKYKDLSDYYDLEIQQSKDAAKAQTDAIQAQVDAMGKEDTKRQELFDNERTRIQRLAQLYSNNIDYNQALNSGNLDSAAKIMSNNSATVQGWGMDDQQKAMDKASQEKQDALSAQIDSINETATAYQEGVQKQKDALSDLQQAEEDAAKARQQLAQDSLQAAKQAYDDQVQAAEDALAKTTQATLDANNITWQDKQTKLNQEVAAITANVPKTVAEEQAQIEAIKKVYQKYGVDLQGYGDQWSGIIANGLTYSIQQAAAGLQSDIAWSQIGTYIDAQISGGANITLDQMLNFLKTGQWPTQTVTEALSAKLWSPPPPSYAQAAAGAGIVGNGRVMGYHAGGQALSGAQVDLSGLTPTQRKGYPANSPMFSSEYLALLEHGEFVVNKQATQQNKEVLHAINSGANLSPLFGFHAGGEAGLGGGGMIAGIANKMEQHGIALAATMIMAISQAAQQAQMAQFYGGLQAADFAVDPKLNGMTYKTLDGIRAKLFPGSVMTSGYRPGNTSPSGGRDFHNMGMAIDIGVPGNSQDRLMPIADQLARYFPNSTELIHNPNGSIKNGKAVPGSFWGASTWNAHKDHVHWAMTAAALAQAASTLPSNIAAAPTDASGNKGVVQSLAQSIYGWTGPEWNALYALVTRESGFRNTAQNPHSTAYGMFQFLDSTWANYGYAKTSDPTIQTKAGLAYIKARYGDPLGAMGHENAYGWYDNGGYLKPGMIGLNGTGKPEPVFTDEQWTVMSSLVSNGASNAQAVKTISDAVQNGSIDSGSNAQYNITVDMTGATIAKTVDMEKAVSNALDKIDAKLGRSRTIG
jgi:TP901 family phage tail tape measure protein